MNVYETVFEYDMYQEAEMDDPCILKRHVCVETDLGAPWHR